MPPMPARMFTGSEVALLWEVTPRTVRRWAEAGRIPSVRLPSGVRRFPVDAVRYARPMDGRAVPVRELEGA